MVTPLEELLYPADILVGERGDIIQFYNKVFIGYIKEFVLRFSPTDSEVRDCLNPGEGGREGAAFPVQ